MSKVVAFLKNKSGATRLSTPHRGGHFLVIIATVNTIGTTLNGSFNSISTQLK